MSESHTHPENLGPQAMGVDPGGGEISWGCHGRQNAGGEIRGVRWRCALKSGAE
jgi:hypothetical protein